MWVDHTIHKENSTQNWKILQLILCMRQTQNEDVLLASVCACVVCGVWCVCVLISHTTQTV